MSIWGGDGGYGEPWPRRSETHRAYIDSRAQITEHRAPTDESVRLLREMEQAAAAKFKDAIRLEGNGFNAVVFFESLNFLGEEKAHCLFDFNGQRFEVEASVSRFEAISDKNALITKLHEKVARCIAAEMIVPAYTKATYGLQHQAG